jgi:hypothetical protein
MKAELVNITEAEYHSNSFSKLPFYSNSIGKIILSKSPKHAWLEHPLLNPAYEADNDTKFALGTVAHAALLQGLDVCEIIDAPDWRTNAAKELRASAYASGKTPLLAHNFIEVKKMVAAAKLQIESNKELGVNLEDGKGEQTILMQANDVNIKTRIDWLSNDRKLIIDYKTTDIGSPSQWIKSIASNGYDMQAALYSDVVEALTGIEPQFVFCVQETSAPYAMYFVSLPPQFIDYGKQRNNRAINIWQNCLTSGRWPMYDNQIMWADLPAWAEGEFVMQEALRSESKEEVFKKFSKEAFLFGSVR